MVAILDPKILPDVRMTVDEFLAADLPEGYRYELVEGVVMMAPVPGIPHDSVLDRLHLLFSEYRQRRPDVVAHVTQRAAVTLPNRSTVCEPDFAVYGPAEMGDKSGKTWKDVTPILVVEVVSPGQGSRDYEGKRRDYWEAGIGEYWIADPEQRRLTVLTRADGAEWSETVFDTRDSHESSAFPDLGIVVGELFA